MRFAIWFVPNPEGLPAGEIARALGVPQNTMSAHLVILSCAGLLMSERRSRSIVYRADLDGLRALMTFLAKEQASAGKRPR